MKKILLLVVLALGGYVAWYFLVTKPKPDAEVPNLQPVSVSQHSDSFNVSVNNVMSSYYALSEAYVNWDSSAVEKHAADMVAKLQEVNFNELKKDDAIYQTAVSYIDASKTKLNTIEGAQSLTESKRAFNMLTQNMYDLLRTIRYDENKIYLQECPMAFNDTESGLWLSKTEDIRNPYLGLHHPKYGKGMLECGETKDKINYQQTADAAQ